jgi:hypothetical protein
MGPAAPGSHLDRRAEGERMVNELQAGWKRYLLAQELGVSVDTLDQWRVGKGWPPTREQLELLSRCVRV